MGDIRIDVLINQHSGGDFIKHTLIWKKVGGWNKKAWEMVFVYAKTLDIEQAFVSTHNTSELAM